MGRRVTPVTDTGDGVTVLRLGGILKEETSMLIPRPERPHGALGAVQARRPQISSTGLVEGGVRPKAAVPTIKTPTKPSRKKSIYADRKDKR